MNSPHPHPRVADEVVIALSDSPRLERFFASDHTRGFRVREAFDGRQGGGDDLFDREAFAQRYGRPPAGGEVGVAISHMHVLREFAESPGADDDVIVVAEDDAVPTADYAPVLSQLLESSQPLGFVLLRDNTGPSNRRWLWSKSESQHQLSWLASRIRSARTGRRYRVGHFDGFLVGAALYLATRAAARRYIRHVDENGRIGWYADDWFEIALNHGTDIRSVRPTLADLEGESMIGYDLRPESRLHVETGVPLPTTALGKLRARIAPKRRLRHLGMARRATLRDVRDRLGSA